MKTLKRDDSMDLNYLSDDIDDIRYFACRHGLKIGEVIELLKLEQEKIKTEHLERIEDILGELSSNIDEIRRELNNNNDLSKIETSIYSVTTAIENLEKNY